MEQIIYDGESVKIIGTEEPDKIIVRFTDTITAYKKIKKAQIKDKGILNCAIAAKIFTLIEENGVPTHYIRQISDCELLCYNAQDFGFEVIVRNVIAGTMARRLGLEEGIVPANVITELCYKREDLNYPIINDHHAVALDLAAYGELDEIYRLSFKINDVLKPFFADRGIILVDFRLRFGRLGNGKVVLSDEITPDSARLWDAETGERLDKDRFRRDLGSVGDAYREVHRRIFQD